MEQHQIFHTPVIFDPPSTVYLDATHLTEVRKGGHQIGIYTLTTTGKKRGILLPTDIWYALVRCSNLINVTIDLTTGKLTTANVTETIYQQQYHQQQYQEQLASINSLYDNQQTFHNGPQKATRQATKPYQRCKPEQQQKEDEPQQNPYEFTSVSYQQNQPYTYQLFENTQTSQTLPFMEFCDRPFTETGSTSYFSEQPPTMEEKGEAGYGYPLFADGLC